MGNSVLIQPTKFVDFDLDGRETGVSYGLRVSDDHASTYANWDESPEKLTSMSVAELVEHATNIDGTAMDIIRDARENDTPLYVGSRCVEWPGPSPEGPGV